MYKKYSIVVCKSAVLYLTVLNPLLQAPLTRKDTAVLSGSLNVHKGNGTGNVGVSVRRIISTRAWGEVSWSPFTVWCDSYNLTNMLTVEVRVQK